MNQTEKQSEKSTESNLPDIRKLWDFHDPEGTEKKFREVLPQAKSSGDRSYHLELLTQIARTYGLRRKFDEAHKILNEVESQLTDDLKRAHVRYFLERGRAHNSSGDKEKAKPLFIDAWNLANEAGEDPLALDAAHMIAIVESPEESIKWSDSAIDLALKSTDPNVRSWLGPLYHNTGMTCIDIKDYDRAMTYFEKNLDFRMQSDDQEPIFIARWMIAYTHRLKGEVDKAYPLQLEILKDREKQNMPGGFNYEEIAECLIAMGKEVEAREFFKKAWPLLKDIEWLKHDQPERYNRIKQLAGE